MSFRFVRLVSRLPACCLSPPLRPAGSSRGAPLRLAGPSLVALFPDLPGLRLLRLPSGLCPDLPPRFLQLPPGSCLTCLRAPCGLFSVQTIRVIPFRTASRVVPYLPPGSLWPLLGSDHPGYPLPDCLPGRALLASGLPVASSRFGPSGLSPNCLPGCALTCLPAFCSPPWFGPFTLPSGCTFSCPPPVIFRVRAR